MVFGLVMTAGGIAVAGASPGGGPDYSTVAVTVELQSVVLPDLPVTVEIAGEQVPWAMDLPVWLALADCEWATSWHTEGTVNGTFFGRFQWLLSTWRNQEATVGYPTPASAPVAVQIEAARENLDRSSWASQWPGCSRRLGFR